MIPSASLHLLNQDNSIPGNRKDGFRYHHLLFLIVATPVYLWLELSFGVMLLDQIGSQVVEQDTRAIEHWGRLISGLAVSLLFLAGWFKHCEKMNYLWPLRIGVALAISLACILLTWWAQGKVIDFYVMRSSAEITWALRTLAVVVVVGFVLLRMWIRYATQRNKHLPVWQLMGGLAAILLAGHAVIHIAFEMLPAKPENLGAERQQVATLTLVRRSLEERIYSLQGIERDERVIRSAEGKAFLALFPVLGSVLDQKRFAADRPALIHELMQRDWLKEYGAQSFSAYRQVVAELRAVYDDVYRKSAGSADGPQRVRAALEANATAKVPPGLDWPAFAALPAATRFLQVRLGCLDCAFHIDMNEDTVGRELFAATQMHNVKQAVDRFASPEHFEKGSDGERAARIFWVPIWALLFSMVGAFTHIFRMIFVVTEYAHRVTFHSIRAADSPLAAHVIRNSRVVTAAVVAAMAGVIYFADNSVTSHPRYVELRPEMWRKHPIVGALAAHWTVNAQGFSYPFTSKMRPDWLRFENDPLAYVPFMHDELADEP